MVKQVYIQFIMNVYWSFRQVMMAFMQRMIFMGNIGRFCNFCDPVLQLLNKNTQI